MRVSEGTKSYEKVDDDDDDGAGYFGNSGESETTENGTIHLSKVNKSTFLDEEEQT